MFKQRAHGSPHLSPRQLLLFAFNSALLTAVNKMGVVLFLDLDVLVGKIK